MLRKDSWLSMHPVRLPHPLAYRRWLAPESSSGSASTSARKLKPFAYEWVYYTTPFLWFCDNSTAFVISIADVSLITHLINNDWILGGAEVIGSIGTITNLLSVRALPSSPAPWPSPSPPWPPSSAATPTRMTSVPTWDFRSTGLF